MRRLLPVFLLCFLSFPVLAQDTVTSYFDKLGQPIEEYYEAAYFQVKSTGTGTVRTYHWGDSLEPEITL